MILQSEMTGPGKILEGGLEFVFRTIRIFAGLLPVIDVYVYHRFAIENHLDRRTLASNLHSIPFPVRLACGNRGLLGIVKGANYVFSTVYSG